MKLLKNVRNFGWVVLPQTRSIFIHSVEKPFRLSVTQPFKNVQVDGWAALPNIFCHGPAHFTALNKVFFLMLCRLSTALKWTAGRAPSNTVQLMSRCWVNFSSGWRKTFQKHSKLRLGRAPPNTAQFFPRCWRTFSSRCYAAILKTFKLMAGPRSQHPLSRPSWFRGVKHLFPLMLCRLSTAFKWTAGRAPPNTVQLNSRRWVNFSSGWHETFQKFSKFCLGRAFLNTAQFYSRCYRTFSTGCYAAI